MARTKKYTGNLEQRGDSFRVRLYDRHAKKYVRYTIRTTDRRAAEDFAEAKAKELAGDIERAELGLPAAAKMSTLIDQYEKERLPLLAPNSRKTYGDSLERFREFFVVKHGDPRIDKVRSPHVRAFMDWRRVRAARKGMDGISLRTLQKDRTVLHTLFGYAEELELREGNPVAKVKPPKSDARMPVILSDEQFENLLGECDRDPMLQLYVLALGETGGRCQSEVLWLTWADVDLERGFLLIATGRDGHRTKSGKARQVPMTARLRQALREHVLRFRGADYKGERSPWVFHHVRARRRATAGQRIGNFRRAFQAAAGRAKLPPDLHQHDLRHRRVTTWLAAGKSIVHVKEAMGHSTVRVTEGYTHLVPEHLRSLVDDGHLPTETREAGA